MLSHNSICGLSAVEMAAEISAGRLSVRETLAAHLRRITEVNPQVNAIVTLATGAASSGSTTNRARTTILGAIIGFLIGIVIALATSGGIRRDPEPA